MWVLPTSGEPMRQVTDFGDRSIAITRSVAWASDSRAIYAAVSEVETDIVLLDGLICDNLPAADDNRMTQGKT